jgi:integrase/recombinase XerD
MDKYLEALRRDLLLRDLQATTVEHYIHVVRRFLERVRCDESRFTTEEARSFLLELRGFGRAATTINGVHAGLNFWFSTTLGRPEVMAAIPRCKYRRSALPDVPTMIEVRWLFDATSDPFFRTLFQTIYATGMRSREVRNLQVAHIRSAEGIIRIPRDFGKGRKERNVPLSSTLLALLREHWKRCDLPGPHLFPARVWYGYFATIPDLRRPWTKHPVSDSSANLALHRAQVAARIDKRITLHSLRHAFATHLLEHGVEIRRLQVLLGHANLRTTEFYTHVRTDILKKVPSPLDLLPVE